MHTLSEIQIFVKIIYIILVAYSLVLFGLFIIQMINRRMLLKARSELKDLNDDLNNQVKLRTAELRASEEMYRSLFEQSQEAIFVVDMASMQILLANQQAKEMSGFRAEKLKGKNFLELAGIEESELHSQKRGECTFKTSGGEIRLIEFTAGEVTYMGKSCLQIICRDLTEQRTMEAQKLQNEKILSLGLMAAGVAHELKNPLGVIYNSIYFIRGELENAPPIIKKHIGYIESEIDICREIIDNLGLSSLGESDSICYKTFDIEKEVIKRIIGMWSGLMHKKELELKLELSGVPLIESGINPLLQVINNLIDNAVNAMETGDTLTISTRHLPKYTFTQRTQPVEAVEISISDTGKGMTESELKNAIVPFYSGRRKTGGTGLGLWISYNYIKKLGGDIIAESKLGKGTKFTLYIPVNPYAKV